MLSQQFAPGEVVEDWFRALDQVRLGHDRDRELLREAGQGSRRGTRNCGRSRCAFVSKMAPSRTQGQRLTRAARRPPSHLRARTWAACRVSRRRNRRVHSFRQWNRRRTQRPRSKSSSSPAQKAGTTQVSCCRHICDVPQETLERTIRPAARVPRGRVRGPDALWHSARSPTPGWCRTAGSCVHYVPFGEQWYAT